MPSPIWRRHVTAAHGVLVGISDVDGVRSHRNAACGQAAFAGDHDLGAASTVVGTGGAEIAVVAAQRQSPAASAAAPRPGAITIPTGTAAIDVADLYVGLSARRPVASDCFQPRASELAAP